MKHLATVYGHTGVVGRELFAHLVRRGVSPGYVSLEGESPHADDCEWAFLCLPTPTVNGQQDLSAIYAVAERLSGRYVNVVARSTVLPGTCDWLQQLHPEWRVYHWPEFLTARRAREEFLSPSIQIVGCNDTAPWLETWEDVLPKPHVQPFTFYTTLATAELIKYAHNCHGAMQVIFANLLYDAAMKSGANFDQVRATLPALGYVRHSTVTTYWNPWKDGYRGYGGVCFPKDVAAFADYMTGQAELLEGMEAANARLREPHEA